jgi:hypothetical protein
MIVTKLAYCGVIRVALFGVEFSIVIKAWC